jgi:UDP-N-acetylglucosamine/UDP-N-acetylgalactosamine diphosphorylase
MPHLPKEALAALIREVDGDSQVQLLEYYDELPTDQQATFASQIERTFVRGSVGPTTVFHDSLAMSSEPPKEVQAPTAEEVATLDADSGAEAVAQAGWSFIAQGKAAVVVLAGGSGTRLGVSYPKGFLECPDLLVKKSLFRLQCERVQRAQERARSFADTPEAAAKLRIPLVYMTSPSTDDETRRYFNVHDYFGLDASQVLFCCQSTMPCFTPDGRIILADKARLAEAPGGNAGIYAALSDGGVLDELEARGVEYCQVCTVDNLLGVLADPIFFGLAAQSKGRLEIAVKSVTKAHDHEKVGVFARRVYPAGALAVAQGVPHDALRWGVVEYTEIGAELAAAKNETTGKRRFDCGNIGIHLFSMPFLRRAAEAMKQFSYYHVARKPIPTKLAHPRYDRPSEGPAVVEGVKLEAFIFDIFLLADTDPAKGAFKLLQVDRAEEFSPIKNADNPTATAAGAAVMPDSPASAVEHLHAMHARWLREAVRECRGSKDAEVKQEAAVIDPAAFPDRVEFAPAFACFGISDVVSRLHERPKEGGPTFLALLAAKLKGHARSEPLSVGSPDDFRNSA